jgi:hypothetical protein
MMVSMTQQSSAPQPPAPVRAVLPADDRRTHLVEHVTEAIHALPFYFDSKTVIEGLDAGDLFSLNSVLGGTIEVQTVNTLNRIRNVWDPSNEWAEYGFERSTQTFPDVRLVSRRDIAAAPVLGIELKGWYLLAKEKAPSYRYTAARDACSEYDLLVVVPWHLADVLSGTPVVRDPYVEQARYAAEMRNYYWQYQRGVASGFGIVSPENVHPYPSPKTQTSDKPEKDSGGNFGRVARVHGLMNKFISDALEARISGIEASYWIDFFKVFTDASDPDQISANMARLLIRDNRVAEASVAEDVMRHLLAISAVLTGDRQSDFE